MRSHDHHRDGAGSREPRPWFWIEAGLAVLTGVLCALTLAWKDWIEAVFRVDPDQHSGSLEWLIVSALFLVSLGSAVLARFEWRRPGESRLAEELSE